MDIELILSIILPFFNEISNILTSSGIKKFQHLYPDVPTLKKEKLSKLFIDFISLVGIIISTVRTTKKHGKRAGIIKGIGVLLLAYVIPSLTIHSVIETVCSNCGPIPKIIIGLILIGCLIGFEYGLDKLIVEKEK
jgi:hypothetical protein